MNLSKRFADTGGHLSSEIYPVLMVMDNEGVEFNRSDEEFAKLIRSIAVELKKLDRLEIGMRALENIKKNNELK